MFTESDLPATSREQMYEVQSNLQHMALDYLSKLPKTERNQLLSIIGRIVYTYPATDLSWDDLAKFSAAVAAIQAHRHRNPKYAKQSEAEYSQHKKAGEMAGNSKEELDEWDRCTALLRDAPIAQVYLMTLQSNMQIWPHIKSRKELGSREMIYDEVKYGDAGKKGNGRGDNKSAEDERNVNYVKAMILKARKVAGEEK